LQELYGDEVAGSMLNALSRLLTSYLQAAGFTCGMDDLLLVPSAEAQRARVSHCVITLLKIVVMIVDEGVGVWGLLVTYHCNSCTYQ
jgi:hypothetical protein